MPRYPSYAKRTERIGGSVFETFREKMAARGDRLAALHIGDSYQPPPYALPIDATFTRAHAGFNRYCDTFGVSDLRAALVRKLGEDNAVDAGLHNILITAGATNALSITAQALLDAGDEVIVLAPYWPFFRGMVRMAGARVVEVPFYTRLQKNPPADVTAMLAPYVNERTAAVYLNTPNNPSGVVLTREEVGAVATFARQNNLWLISDEAYDGMTFDGREHVSPASLDGMRARTVSIFTFSKVFMFAGLRLGYAVSDGATVGVLNKTMVHQLYSPSTLAQQMMVEPVRTRMQWHTKFVEECANTRDRLAERLAGMAPVPGGAYYFFFDVAPYLRGRAFDEFVAACLDADVAVAPGGDFGADFATWIRVCFAGVPPEVALAGVERLCSVLDG